MNPVNWFEIPVKDMARAKSFYSTVIGKELSDMEMPGTAMATFPWEQGGTNAAGALVLQEGYDPSVDGVVIYFQCEDVANELSHVETAGGSVVFPKTNIGEHGFIAQFVDSEGNRIGLHSMN